VQHTIRHASSRTTPPFLFILWSLENTGDEMISCYISKKATNKGRIVCKTQVQKWSLPENSVECLKLWNQFQPASHCASYRDTRWHGCWQKFNTRTAAKSFPLTLTGCVQVIPWRYMPWLKPRLFKSAMPLKSNCITNATAKMLTAVKVFHLTT